MNNNPPSPDESDTEILRAAFQQSLQDDDLLQYFSYDEASRAIVTDFVNRNFEQIIQRYEAHPGSVNGRIISNQIFATLIREMLEETGFEDPVAVRFRRLKNELASRVLAILPELDGDSLVFQWKIFFNPEKENSLAKQWILLLDGKEILREKAYWQDYWIYLTVLDCLVQKYGNRVADFIPDNDIGFLTMYGDDLAGPGNVAAARERYFGKCE